MTPHGRTAGRGARTCRIAAKRPRRDAETAAHTEPYFRTLDYRPRASSFNQAGEFVRRQRPAIVPTIDADIHTREVRQRIVGQSSIAAHPASELLHGLQIVVARLTYEGRHEDHDVGVWPLVLPEHWCGVFEPQPVDRSQRNAITAGRRCRAKISVVPCRACCARQEVDGAGRCGEAGGHALLAQFGTGNSGVRPQGRCR
ncbi:MAG: hypothetical protein GXY83_40655 [Rhodopirellula sp.]|nr:hypothetical protein [Rhodopirellula sp.]